MKKGLIASYFSGITDRDHGEGYGRIIRYFIPEFITAMTLYSALYLIDAWFIADLKSTTTYATLGITNVLMHFIVKLAEGISVGTIVLGGRYNGEGKYEQVGRSLRDSFWINCFVGAGIASVLYFGAYWIYYFYGVPEEMIVQGVPFLRLRALGVFFTCIYFSFIGFMRGVKNTKTPMRIFIAGGILFVILDYLLIFGKFGFPKLGLMGSAIATVVQYVFMMLCAMASVLLRKQNRKYGIQLFSLFNSGSQVWNLIKLSWPIVLDKCTIAAAYIWLGGMIAPMGTLALASFAVIKDMERFAIQPAAAFAQVITFLVSNDYGAKRWQAIKSNIKKVVFISSIGVFSILLILSIWSRQIISIFDQKGEFTEFAAYAFPLLSVLFFFDLLQLVLAAALRGASNVKTVMFIRLGVCLGFFVPVSYLLAYLDFESQLLKFILVYGSFYVSSGLMSLLYVCTFRSERWKTKST